MSSFDEVESVWASHLGNLRNRVRQHVIAHQLGEQLEDAHSVLDVGCGQGTQAIALASSGKDVTGVEPSSELLAMARSASSSANLDSITWLQGDIDHLDELLSGEQFDAACAHGLLMYLDDPLAALRRLVSHVRPGGRVSFTVRNGDALAFRPGTRGRWADALAAFDSDGAYVNELGASARAHRLAQVLGWCQELHLTVNAWYGVRVFTDSRPSEATVADVDDLCACLAAETKAGETDPYRSLGAQLHVIASVPHEDRAPTRAQ